MVFRESKGVQSLFLLDNIYSAWSVAARQEQKGNHPPTPKSRATLRRLRRYDTVALPIESKEHARPKQVEVSYDFEVASSSLQDLMILSISLNSRDTPLTAPLPMLILLCLTSIVLRL